MGDPADVFGATRPALFRFFFLGAFLFLLYQFLRILSPFFTPLLAAFTLALIFYPLHARLARLWPDRPNLAAAAGTGTILLIVILPLLGLAWLLIGEAANFAPAAQHWFASLHAAPPDDPLAALPPRVQDLWRRLDAFLSAWQIDLQDFLLKNIDQLGGRLTAYGARALKNAVFVLVDVLVATFTLFFFFRDGVRTGRFLRDLLPMEPAHKDMILGRVTQTLSAVVRGVFLTAAAQGTLAGLGFVVAGVRFAVLLGFATSFAALVPVAGATAVWLPVCAVLYLKGATLKAVLLAVWGTLVVSATDNFLRPWLIGEKARLPVFLLFFGILGGLQVYGFTGILLGPLLIAAVLAFVKIYREQIPSAADAAPPPRP